MSERPLRDIFKAKDLGNPYLLAGLAGRYAATHELDSFGNRQLDRVMARVALGNLELAPSPDIAEQYDETQYWHGTGRFKYIDGEVVDVLDSIATTEQLKPSYDAFDLTRPMTSISLARARVYGRAYADMYGRGADEMERYGSSLFWACAFLGSVAIEACQEVKVWRPSGYYQMMHHLREAGAVDWYKKTTSVARPGVVDIYRNGSDIPGNYPILFGVRDVEEVPVSRAVAIHEVRTEQPLAVDGNVTHLEVPRRFVEETQRLMGGVAIRAIEDGEHFSAQYSFSQHMHEVI